MERWSLAKTIFVGAIALFSQVAHSRAQCLGEGQWKQIGPGPLTINVDDGARGSDGRGPDSGLVTAIAIDPRGTSDQTIYIGGDGGVWKTTDRGLNWQPKTDSMPFLHMGAVALDPGTPSIVYAGTGDTFNQGGQRSGVGIYKSGDGGNTWTILNPLGIFNGRGITRILVLPGNVVLVGTQVPGGQSGGLYRSVDGGANFGNNELVNDGIPILPDYVTDLDADTASPGTIYACVYGSVMASGVYKSTDGGQTFSKNLFTATNGGVSHAGYISFAQSTLPDNRTLYVNVQFLYGPPPRPPSGPEMGMFKSTNGGDSWSPIALTDEPSKCQCNYAQTIGVDPQDRNRVYLGTRALFMGTDVGSAGLGDADRIDLYWVHADQHALVFSPPTHVPGGYQLGRRTPLYNGTDGGIATTADAVPNGGSWTLLNGSIATVPLRQIDIGRGNTANNAYTYGAAQDLGISSHTPENPNTIWHQGQGGDGLSISVDPDDPRHANAVGNTYFVGTIDGVSWQQGGRGLPGGPGWVYFDPSGKNILYANDAASAYQLFQSKDGGINFSLMQDFGLNNASLTAINMVKGDPKTIWLGRKDGTVFHTGDANHGTGANWRLEIIAGAPNQGVIGIAIDPSNIGRVVVVYPSGVFMTSDNGTTWINITGNLANGQLNSVVIDPNTLPQTIIVATDNGVMRTVISGGNWQALGVGLPNIQCTSLALDSTAIPSILRVGTYGRSAFELAYDRQYVDWRSILDGHDGTREHPFFTVIAALNAASNGGTRYINIQAGNYPEAPIPINQCVTLNAIGGPVTIR